MSDVVAKRVLEGITLALVGVILLLNTTGQLPWSVWLHILSLWPLLLVAAGLEIIAKGVNAEWLRVVSSLLVIGGLLVGAFVLPVGGSAPGFGGFWGPSAEDFETVEPLTGRVDTGRATIKGGVGSYTIGAGDDLISVTGRSVYGAPDVSSAVDGRAARVSVSGPEAVRVWVPGLRSTSRVDVRLARSVLWDVEIDTGVVDLNADLSGLVASSVDVRSGVSQVRLTLGEVPSGIREVPVDVRGGVANFTVRVPDGVPVRVDAEAGLTNISVDSSIPRTSSGGRVWMSPEFSSEGGFRIRFEAGVSNVEVVRY